MRGQSLLTPFLLDKSHNPHYGHQKACKVCSTLHTRIPAQYAHPLFCLHPSIHMSYLYNVVFLVLPCIKLCSFTHTPSPQFASPFFLTKVHFIDKHVSMHPPSHIHGGYSHTLPGALDPQNCKCCPEHPQDGEWCPEQLFSKKKVCKIHSFKSTAQTPQGVMGWFPLPYDLP